MPIRTISILFSLLALVTGVAFADEASIRAEFAKKYPQANIESISKTPYLGLYEMLVDGEVMVGATLPAAVPVYPIPASPYVFSYVNGQRVVIEPAARKIVYVVR